MELTLEEMVKKFQMSDAWVARAVWRLAQDAENLKDVVSPAPANDDLLFFEKLSKFFEENGFFTDRHIAVARAKLRPQYIQYLFHISTLPEILL